MTSKIINMAERIKDPEDRMLEALFESAPIADNGFAAKVVRRLRQRLWIRRLALPVALLVGGSIAFKPLVQLTTATTTLLDALPGEFTALPVESIPQLPTLLMGAALLGVAMLTARMLQE